MLKERLKIIIKLNKINNPTIFFLKIDVEGYEDDVLYGSLSLLNLNKIKYIFFEYYLFCIVIIDIMIDGVIQDCFI